MSLTSGLALLQSRPQYDRVIQSLLEVVGDNTVEAALVTYAYEVSEWCVRCLTGDVCV
jgi:hypothetical protein